MALRDRLRDRASVGSENLNRRGFLKLMAGGSLTAAGARVGYELIGFGRLSGTNLTQQDIGPLARQRLSLGSFELSVSNVGLAFDGGTLTLEALDGPETDSLSLGDSTAADAAALGSRYGLESSLGAFFDDVTSFWDTEFAVEVLGLDAFFNRLQGARPRPLMVAALRGDGYSQPSADDVSQFTGRALDDPEGLVSGLAQGFREHTHFDTSRYVITWIEDYVLFDVVSLQRFVADDTTFEALLDGTTGLYCWEYTFRSIEALHAAPPHQQSPPVFGAIVVDHRHNHMYTGLASVVRIDGELRIPFTFLDYSHATMYDTFHLRWLLEDDIDAYDTNHRVSDIHYSA